MNNKLNYKSHVAELLAMTGNSLNIDNNYRGYTLHNAQVLRVAGPCALQYSDFRSMHYRIFNCISEL